MTRTDERTVEALSRIFHEPARLAIMSALCAADRGLTFTELRDTCQLTDGNLSRHLKALEEAGVIRVEKKFVAGKPRTTVQVSKRGIDRFTAYLAALEDVLKAAQAAIPREARSRLSLPAQLQAVRT